MKSAAFSKILRGYYQCAILLTLFVLILFMFTSILPCSAREAKPPDKPVILFMPFENYSEQTHLHPEMCVAMQNIFNEKYLNSAELIFTYKDEPFKTNGKVNYVIETTIHEIDMRHGVKGIFLKKFKGAIVPVEINIQNALTGKTVYHETIIARGDQSPPIGGVYGLFFGMSDKNTIAKAFEKLAVILPEQLPDL